MLGILGKLTFETSSNRMLTFKDLEVSSQTRYGQHDTLQGKPKLEFTGEGLDEIKLKLYWRIEDKVNPTQEIKPLEEQREKGEVISFVLGGEKVGSGFYIIESINKAPKRIDNKGNILAEGFDISLKEYRIQPHKPQTTNKRLSPIQKGLLATPSIVPAIVTKSPSAIVGTGLTITKLIKPYIQSKRG